MAQKPLKTLSKGTIIKMEDCFEVWTYSNETFGILVSYFKTEYEARRWVQELENKGFESSIFKRGNICIAIRN